MNASAPPFGSPVSRPLRWGWLAWAYAVAIVYVSTILGPAGLNFVPRDPLAAFGDFLSMPYNVHGSDQRQDWMANMLMFAVLGFLLSAALTGTGRTRPGRLLGAFTIAVGFLLTVKYAQLYFPPRTVSINYVLAQTLGAAIGVSVFALLRRRVDEALAAIAAGGRRLLIAALALYSAAFLLFIVFPFDFTLSADDLAERLAVLPSVLMGWPGDDRSLLFRIVLSLASIATAAPLGMLLRLANPRRGGMALLVTAMIAIGAAMAAAMFVISAQPKLATLVLRAIGVAIGLAIARRLERGGIDRLLPYLRASVPVVAIAYLAMLGLTKNVFTTDYDSLAGAIDRFAPNGLLPLWHHYIVSKSQAARSVLVQIVLFAPIGVMTWLIAGRGRGAAWFAGLSALLLAEAIEVARWLQPALQPDFTNGFIAAAAAVAMFRLSPILWSMVAELRPASPSVDRHPGVATMITPGIRSRESTRVPDIEPASDIELPLDPVPSGPVATPHLEAAQAPMLDVPPAPLPDRRPTLGHWIVAAIAAAVAIALVVVYPLSRPILGATALATSVLLWLWPGAWPVIVPSLLCAVDLMPWSGWILASESDVLVAAALAALAVRRPPALRDLRMPRIVALPLLFLVAVVLLGLVIGLTRDAAIFAHTANPYLHPHNALRVSKGLALALLLLPFLRTDWRRDPRTPGRLAAGFTVALAITATIAIAERLMFVDAFDIATDYRVVGPFTAMHLGGSQLAVFLVLAIPFAIAHLLVARASRAVPIALAIAVGFFALAATYTRAAYAAILLGLAAFAIASVLARRAPPTAQALVAGGTRRVTVVIAALFAVLAGGAMLGIAGAGFMSERLKTTGGDLGLRLANWRDGLAMRDPGLLTRLFGMGSGTFARINAARGQAAVAPTDYWLATEEGRRFLSIRSGAPLYFGQKVALRPERDHRLSLRLRAPDGGAGLMVVLCEKLVLYSANCSGPAAPLAAGSTWERVEIPLSAHMLAGSVRSLLPSRPFELTFWIDQPGRRIDVAEISLSDAAGRPLLRNGSFRDGMTRWAITDDYHWAWRIEGEYAAALFDGGIAKLMAMLLVFCVALIGALRLTLAGHVLGPPLVAAVVTTMASAIFDQPLQAPRLAALLYLVLFAAMAGFVASQGRRRYESGHDRRDHPSPAAVSRAASRGGRRRGS